MAEAGEVAANHQSKAISGKLGAYLSTGTGASHISCKAVSLLFRDGAGGDFLVDAGSCDLELAQNTGVLCLVVLDAFLGCPILLNESLDIHSLTVDDGLLEEKMKETFKTAAKLAFVISRDVQDETFAMLNTIIKSAPSFALPAANSCRPKRRCPLFPFRRDCGHVLPTWQLGVVFRRSSTSCAA